MVSKMRANDCGTHQWHTSSHVIPMASRSWHTAQCRSSFGLPAFCFALSPIPIARSFSTVYLHLSSKDDQSTRLHFRRRFRWSTITRITSTDCVRTHDVSLTLNDPPAKYNWTSSYMVRWPMRRAVLPDNYRLGLQIITKQNILLVNCIDDMCGIGRWYVGFGLA